MNRSINIRALLRIQGSSSSTTRMSNRGRCKGGMGCIIIKVKNYIRKSLYRCRKRYYMKMQLIWKVRRVRLRTILASRVSKSIKAFTLTCWSTSPYNQRGTWRVIRFMISEGPRYKRTRRPTERRWSRLSAATTTSTTWCTLWARTGRHASRRFAIKTTI